MSDAAWVALSLIRGIGGRTISALVDVFGSPEAVLNATPRQLQAIKGVGPAICAAIKAINLAATLEDLLRWQAAGISVIAWDDVEYPPALRNLHDAPPTLFIKGNWPVNLSRAVAIVGTRTPSPDALKSAQDVSHACIQAGVTVVSGLALGIDTAAHKEAVIVPDAVTVAVLGSGLLTIYPPENRELAAAVMRHGALICEVRPDSRVSTTGLVARNRIISGLSQALVVVQTDADGGALHAARFAKAQGRPVYFVDNPLGNPAAQRGIDILRAEGAKPIPMNVNDLSWL